MMIEYNEWCLLSMKEISLRHAIERRELIYKQEIKFLIDVEFEYSLAVWLDIPYVSLMKELFREYHCGLCRIELMAICELENVIRIQLSDEQFSQTIIVVDWFNTWQVLVLEYWRKKKEIEKQMTEFKHDQSRIIQEEILHRSHSSVIEDACATLTMMRFQEQYHRTERSAIEDVENVIRFQLQPTEEVIVFEILYQCISEVLILMRSQRQDLHFIERAGLSDVETFIRYQFSDETINRYYEIYLPALNQFTIICDEYWTIKKRIEQEIISRKETIFRLCESTEAFTSWICLCQEISLKREEALFMIGKHKIEREGLFRCELIDREVFQGHVQQSMISCYEYCKRLIIDGFFHEERREIERQVLIRLETTSRSTVFNLHTLDTIVVEEEGVHILMKHVFMRVIFTIQHNYLALFESRTRWEVDHLRNRSIDVGHSEYFNFGQITSRHNQIMRDARETAKRTSIWESEDRERVDIDNQMRLQQKIGWWKTEKRKLNFIILIRIEQEVRSSLSDRLIDKWDEFTHAVNHTLQHFWKKESVVAVAKITLISTASFASETIIDGERSEFQSIMSLLSTSTLITLREHPYRCIVREEESRNWLFNVFIIHMALLNHQSHNILNIIKQLEIDELVQFTNWGATRKTDGLSLLKLMRASPTKVHSTTSTLQGLRSLRECVIIPKKEIAPKQLIKREVKPVPSQRMTRRREIMSSVKSNVSDIPKSVNRNENVSSQEKVASIVLVNPPHLFYYSTNSEIVSPSPIVRFLDGSGYLVKPIRSSVHFHISKPKRSTSPLSITSVTQEGYDWIINCTSNITGRHNVNITCDIDEGMCDGVQLNIMISVLVEDKKPDGVSNPSWKLFKLLQSRMESSPRTIDSTTRNVLATVRENKNFSHLRELFSDRYPWLRPDTLTSPPTKHLLVPLSNKREARSKLPSPKKHRNRLPPIRELPMNASPRKVKSSKK